MYIACSRERAHSIGWPTGGDNSAENFRSTTAAKLGAAMLENQENEPGKINT